VIRETLDRVRRATFCVELPNKAQHGMPSPTGTGFFVSPDGWFVTAAHVVSENGAADGPQRNDIDKAWLMKESQGLGPGAMCQFITLEHVLPEFDLALLKVDFGKNANKEWLKEQSEFPYIQVSTRQLEMGESVYSFGYPLSSSKFEKQPSGIVGSSELSPRLTSAIVSSELDKTKMVMTGNDPQHYVLDKALNYGNSGGPIVSSETGHVHALCSRFQPVFVPQAHLADAQGRYPHIMIPSLYGVVSSLRNNPVIQLFAKLNIPLVPE
jgi:serine protease Do